MLLLNTHQVFGDCFSVIEEGEKKLIINVSQINTCRQQTAVNMNLMWWIFRLFTFLKMYFYMCHQLKKKPLHCSQVCLIYLITLSFKMTVYYHISQSLSLFIHESRTNMINPLLVALELLSKNSSHHICEYILRRNS